MSSPAAGTPDLRLRVNGREYGGWKRVRFTRSIEAIAGSFHLEVTDRWAGQSEPWPIREEDECELVVGGRPIITGCIDHRAPAFGPEEHSLSVDGRDATGELVDCSAVLDAWEFLQTPLLTLAKKLAAPFGISVSLQAGISPPAVPAKTSIDPGETAFEVLDRLCRQAGVLPVSDGGGGLVLTRAGSTRAVTELVQGQNILSASGDYDATQRYRTYRVLGQHQGTDEYSGAAAATVKGEATDSTVRRSKRVLLVRPDGNATAEQAQRRAEWEAIVRAGRAYSVEVNVQGWTQGDGSLWPVNGLVRLRSSLLGIDSDMLIAEATSSLDDSSGSTTRLALRRPDAFAPEPAITEASAKSGGASGGKTTTAPWAELARGV